MIMAILTGMMLRMQTIIIMVVLMIMVIIILTIMIVTMQTVIRMTILMIMIMVIQKMNDSDNANSHQNDYTNNNENGYTKRLIVTMQIASE